MITDGGSTLQQGFSNFISDCQRGDHLQEENCVFICFYFALGTVGTRVELCTYFWWSWVS